MQTVKRRKLNSGQPQGTHVATELVGRSIEFAALHTYLLSSINSQRPSSVFITGKPGTGKTFTVECVMRELTSRKTINDKIETIIQTNGLQASSAHNLFALLAGKLLIEAPKKGCLEAKVCSRLSRKQGKMILLVVDEVDGLFLNNKEWLYRLFSLPFELSSKLILVTIANSVDLGSRIMPNLTKRGYKPFEVLFSPYTVDEIKEILNSRLKENSDTNAIEYSARQCAKIGDIRLALELCNRAEEEGKLDFKSVLQKVKSPKQAMLMNLPSVQQVTLAACVSLGFEQSLKFTDFYTYYTRKCRDNHVDALSLSEFNETLRSFEAYGFARFDHKADFRKSQIEFSLSPAEVKRALPENLLVNRVLNC